VEWGEVFRLTVNPLELIVRGAVTYWFIFVLFRVRTVVEMDRICKGVASCA
jgi:hypothetical protein